MNFFIQNMIELWLLTCLFSFGIALLALFRGSQLAKEPMMPLEEISLIPKYGIRAILPFFNLVYAFTWGVLLFLGKDPIQFQYRKK